VLKSGRGCGKATATRILKDMRLALLAVLVFLPACGKLREVKKSVEGVVTVQKAVQQATGQENITVFLNNGRYLGIGLVNSPWKSLPPAEKAAKARQVAGLAVAAYPDRSSLARINVTYTTNRTYFLVLHYTNTTDSYAFDPTDLRRASPEGRQF
jgi:hypothetical protein